MAKGSRLKSKKGILITLLVIILFILMLGEVLSYVIANINYDVLASTQAQLATQNAARASFNTGASAFLYSGLRASFGTLLKWEAPGALKSSHNINNTAYFLTSLMTNGTVYGENMTQYIGTATLKSYVNATMLSARAQGLLLTITNSTIRVFQGSSSTINATYRALFTLTSTAGQYSFVVSASSWIPLNGTPDPIALSQGQVVPISFSPTYPIATTVGDIRAKSGSTGPFMFAYGTLVVEQNTVNCAALPAAVQNANYILVIADAVDIPENGCHMGGLVTADANSVTPLVPYLVYANSVVFNSVAGNLQNGTAILLDGEGLALLNITALQTGLQNGYYYASRYAPSYLDIVGGEYGRASQAGMVSLASINTKGLSLVGTGNVMLSNSITVGGNYSVSLWFQTSNSYSQPIVQTLISSLQPGSDAFDMQICGAGSTCSPTPVLRVDVGNGAGWDVNAANVPFYFNNQTWYNIVMAVNNIGTSVFVNGMGTHYTYAYDQPLLANTIHMITVGSGNGGSGQIAWLNGRVENVQVYSEKLSRMQAQQEFLGGLLAPPVMSANLIGWWPLNGDANDYSANARNGIVENGNYVNINSYYGDTLLPYAQALRLNYSVVEGALACSNINQCTNPYNQNMYLDGLPLAQSGQAGSPGEAQALGLANATVPRVLSFSANGYVMEQNSIKWLAGTTQPFTVSIWVYPRSTNGVVLDEFNSSQGIHTSWIEISGGVGYVSYGKSTQPGVCSAIGAIPVNRWSNIVMTYTGSTSFIGYVNGVVANTISSAPARSAPSGSAFYALGLNDTHNCGSGAAFLGMMSNFQVFNSVLTASQVQQLYTNNSVSNPFTPINMSWTLSDTSDGMLNRTGTAINTNMPQYPNNWGNFYTNGILCSNANMIAGTCGVEYVPG